MEKTNQPKGDWSAFLCEVCEKPYHECFCYGYCENCDQPSNECMCNAYTGEEGQQFPQPVETRAPPPTSQKTGICVYYAQGRCTFGDACKYAHVFSGATSNKSEEYNGNGSSDVCKFYMAGNCKFGKSCRFSHSVPITSNSNINVNTTNHQASSFDHKNPNDIKTGNHSQHVGDSKGSLSAKMSQLVELRVEISLLESVLDDKRSVEIELESEINAIQQQILYSN